MIARNWRRKACGPVSAAMVSHEAFERLTAVTRPMHEYRKQPVRHFGETTGLGSVNDRPAVLGLLRGLGV